MHEGPGGMPAERFDALLPEMALLIGQSDMPKARLDRAQKLRAIVNVETNFLQNVDYDVLLSSAGSTCSRRAPPSRNPSPR